MRCVYCYNPEIVLGKGQLKLEAALTFIASRKHLIAGVVFSGGECTLYPQLGELAVAVKAMGLAVKLDTNGTRPQVLEHFIQQGWVDYVALDFKAPLEKYNAITKTNLFESFVASLTVLINAGIPFEVRTTIHHALLSREDLSDMLLFLEKMGYTGCYYLQLFVNDVPTLGCLRLSYYPADWIPPSTDRIQVVLRHQ